MNTKSSQTIPPNPTIAPLKVLIANRGEVAVRIARAAAELGLSSVAVYSRDDAASLHIGRADEAVALAASGAPAYLDAEALIAAALATRCNALHPGYGFLSENAGFARLCAKAGLLFIGPRPGVLDVFGDKAAARRLAEKAGVPVSRGLSSAVSLEQAEDFYSSLGRNGRIMIKAVAGGGGRGMRIVESAEELAEAYAAARSEAFSAFGADAVYVEELIAPARHVEVQIVGDADGAVAHLFERECSLQRRQQKLLEFAPSPSIDPALRARLCDAAVALARAARVHTLCTMEFLVDGDGRFVFMEANPRLQVEHTVTEEVLGVDLVQAQFRLAAGATLESLGLTQDTIGQPRGMALQLRINMERVDGTGAALPTGGTLRAFDSPGGTGIRLDTFARAGDTPATSFDSLLAKLVVHAPTGGLPALLARAYRALGEFRIEGVDVNLGFLQNLLCDPEVQAGRFDTRFVERHAARLSAGTDAHVRHYAAGTSPIGQGADVASRITAGPDGATTIAAPLGGRVVRFAVAPGDTVRPGQVVAVIEAMKMEHTVQVQTSGLVLSMGAMPGDAVIPGAPLLFVDAREVDGDHAVQEAVADDTLAAQRLADLHARKHALLDAGRPDAVARQRARGMLTARERIAQLCDAGSFTEMGGLIQPENMAAAPADGIVIGSARIDGRAVMLMSQDFTVFGGSAGHLGKNKLGRALVRARMNGMPFVMLFDGGGHRIQEGQNSRAYAGSTTVFQEFARMSGWVPIVAAVLGAGFAANTNYCAFADLTVMVRGQGEMGLAGPALVKAGTGETITGQALGGADVQVDRNGLAELGVNSEDEAFGAIRRFLSFLPSNASLPPPRISCDGVPDSAALRHLVPANTRHSYDMRRVVNGLVDLGSIFEVKPTYGASILTTLARLDGRPVGIIANQPLHKGGMLDSAAAEKAAHFIALCDAYGLPLIYLIDVPGMAIGSEAERAGLGKRSAKLLFELGNSTVPRVSVVLRKGYGLGYVAMCGGRGFEPDACYAWPTAEICAMSIEGSVDVAYRKKYIDEPDPAAARQNIIDGIRARVSALQAAEGFGIDDVIDPADTRALLLDTLAQAPARRQSSMPPKFRSIAPV